MEFRLLKKELFQEEGEEMPLYRGEFVFIGFIIQRLLGGAPSGFTGLGWFESEANTPMNYYLTSKGKGLQDILSEFDNNTRNNLNDVFEVWSTYVSSQKPGNTIVKDFTIKLYANTSCYNYIY